MKSCKNCNKELLNEKNKFCNNSCATTYNNKHRTIKKKDKTKILIDKICKNCGNFLTLDKKQNIFCDSSCAATYNNKNRTLSEETKIKISMKLTNNIDKYSNRNKYCKYCNKELTLYQVKLKNIFCSHECHNKNGASEETKQKLKNIMQLRIENGLHHGWSTRNIESYPEKFFKKVLENNNIEYEFNKPIIKKNLGMNELGNYFLDFFIVDKNIDLEIDGKQHLLEERIESDKKRDEYLTNNNIIVYRIKWKNINTKNGKEYIKNEIDKFLQFYNKTGA